MAKTLPQLVLLEMRGNELTGTGAAILAAQLEAAPPTGAGALPLRALELSGAALCSTKLAGQLAEEPA